MPLLVSGEVPNTIYENARPGDWVAKLSLSGLTGILDVRLTGSDANRFQAVLDPGKSFVTIVPAMAFDREAYVTAPTFAFGLQVKTASGWIDSGQSWGVALLGVDDNPPHKLSFSAGGSVLETDVGGVIGVLFGEDRDTAKATLTYRVLWPDEAYFEVVNGNVLKLRDGVDLLREGGTVRPVMIEVSDGRQEANFLLDVRVLDTSALEDIPAPPAVHVPPDWGPPPAEAPPAPPPVILPPVTTPPVPAPPATTVPAESPPPVAPPPAASPPVVTPPVAAPPVVAPPVAAPTEAVPPAATPPVAVPPPAIPSPAAPTETPLPPLLPPPGGIPAPPPPQTAVHLVASASDTLLGSLKLAWQAERNTTDAFGQTHVSVSSGELLWLTPQDQQNLASGRLTLPEMAGASEVLHVDASAPGRSGEGPVLLLWAGGMADGLDLGEALRGLLGDGAVQATLAQRDGGLLLHTLQQVAGGLEAGEALPVELHITGPLATPPIVEPVLPGSAAVHQLIALACGTLLDRAPDAGDLARWGHALAAGELDARGLVEAILRSDEYQLSHAGESDREFVAAVYRHAHATEMDATSLGHWTELLESHAIDRADLVMAVGLIGHHRDEAMPGH